LAKFGCASVHPIEAIIEAGAKVVLMPIRVDELRKIDRIFMRAQGSVEIFDFDRPIFPEAILDTVAERPTYNGAMGLIDWRPARWNGNSSKFNSLGPGFGPSQSAGASQPHLVPSTADVVAKGATRFEFRTAVIGRVRAGRADIDISPIPVGRYAKNPTTGLIVGANGATDQTAVTVMATKIGGRHLSKI